MVKKKVSSLETSGLRAEFPILYWFVCCLFVQFIGLLHFSFYISQSRWWKSFCSQDMSMGTNQKKPKKTITHTHTHKQVMHKVLAIGLGKEPFWRTKIVWLHQLYSSQSEQSPDFHSILQLGRRSAPGWWGICRDFVCKHRLTTIPRWQ